MVSGNWLAYGSRVETGTRVRNGLEAQTRRYSGLVRTAVDAFGGRAIDEIGTVVFETVVYLLADDYEASQQD